MTSNVVENGTANAAEKETVKPFTVCTDVELGPILPSVRDVTTQQEKIRQTWERVNKNTKDTSSSTTTEEQHTVIEATSTLLDTTSEDSKWKDCRPVFYDFDSINLLAQTVHKAFYDHYPLRLGPDVIWLTILQGLAKHIDQDPEEFVKGSADNDWTTVFPEFAGMIEASIGKEKASSMTCDFSTSTSTDRICSHIALMDTVKHYFKYRTLCGCGIPSIELTGTVDDWVSLREKAEILYDFDDIEWWTDELFPVLDHFVKAARGSPDIKFWKSVCNVRGLSGMWQGYVTGWVQVFFPYTSRGRRCDQLGEWRKNYERGSGTETEDYNRGVKPESVGGHWGSCGGDVNAGNGLMLKHIPVGVSQAPFEYQDASNGCKYDMTFNAGIVAIVQNQTTKALEPVTGWAVLEHGQIQNSKKRQREDGKESEPN